MICFKAEILKFDQHAEKSGWTYIPISKKISDKLNPGIKKSFRVKGKIDSLSINSVALLPMGNGGFIMALNATMRKALHKNKGATVEVELEVDTAPLKLSNELLACLKEDSEANNFFNDLPPSHQKYFSKWVDEAKTDGTKTRRIAVILNALANKLTYGQMLRMYSQRI